MDNSGNTKDCMRALNACKSEEDDEYFQKDNLAHAYNSDLQQKGVQCNNNL